MCKRDDTNAKVRPIDAESGRVSDNGSELF